MTPGRVVAGLGDNAAFTCISSSPIGSVEWLINGTSLSNEHQQSGVSQEFLITLQCMNVSAEYNNTKIKCIADTVPSSEASTLLVQGTAGFRASFRMMIILMLPLQGCFQLWEVLQLAPLWIMFMSIGLLLSL